MTLSKDSRFAADLWLCENVQGSKSVHERSSVHTSVVISGIKMALKALMPRLMDVTAMSFNEDAVTKPWQACSFMHTRFEIGSVGYLWEISCLS